MRTRQQVAELDDKELLGRFTREKEEGAFAVLVQRHGPLIFALCRRLLPNQHDAEDVFQATFLVLARKARSIRKPGSLGSWLYGVAFRLANRANQQSARRRHQEYRAVTMRTQDPSSELTWRELCWGLDEEMNRLPDKYRTPLLLCYWEGLTQEEAARQLGWPRGTLKRRVERARELLRTRLAKRGMTLSAALIVAMLAPGAGNAQIPATLLEKTVGGASQAVGLLKAGVGATATVMALAEGCLQSMLLAKLKISLIVALAVGLIGSGNRILFSHDEEPPLATDRIEALATSIPSGAETAPARSQPVTLQMPMRVAPQERILLTRKTGSCAAARA